MGALSSVTQEAVYKPAGARPKGYNAPQESVDIGAPVGATRANRSFSLMDTARQFRYGTINDLDLHSPDLPDPIFRPINRYAIFVAPPVSFADMLNAYENDSEISFGVDFATAATVGAGHHFTSPHNRVVDYMEDFATDVNLDFICMTAGRETLAYGNSLWRYVDYWNHDYRFDVLEQMPLTSLKRVWWNGWTADSTVGFYEFRGYKIDRLMPAELVHFRWRVSNASPYGLGLLAPLVQKVDYQYNRNGTDETRTRMAIIDIKRSMQDTLHKVMKRYINRNVYVAPNATPQQQSALASQVDNLFDEQDLVTGEAGMNVLELGSASRSIDLETFTAVYMNEIIKALANPGSRLFEKGALTEASAQSAKEITLMNLAGFALQMKRQVERNILKVWYDANPTTDANGIVIPWKEAKLELQWGEVEKPEITVSDFANLVRAKPDAFSIKDVRQFLADRKVTIDPDLVPPVQASGLHASQLNDQLMGSG